MVHSRLSSSAILFSFVLSSGSISRLTCSKLGRIKKKESICAGDFRAMRRFRASSIRKSASTNLQKDFYFHNSI